MKSGYYEVEHLFLRPNYSTKLIKLLKQSMNEALYESSLITQTGWALEKL